MVYLPRRESVREGIGRVLILLPGGRVPYLKGIAEEEEEEEPDVGSVKMWNGSATGRFRASSTLMGNNKKLNNLAIVFRVVINECHQCINTEYQTDLK